MVPCHSMNTGSVVGTFKRYLMQNNLFVICALIGGRDVKASYGRARVISCAIARAIARAWKQRATWWNFSSEIEKKTRIILCLLQQNKSTFQYKLYNKFRKPYPFPGSEGPNLNLVCLYVITF